MMWRIISIAILAILSIGKASAQAFLPDENALLWEISGRNLPQPSYLYGTIHLIPEKDFWLSEATSEAFAKAEKVVFEINLEQMDDLSNMSGLLAVLSGAIMRDGSTLRQLLSPEDYALVKTRLSKLGLPMFMMERVKPMLLSTLLEQSAAPGAQAGMEGMKSYELEFLRMAQEQKKPVDGLETATYQLKVLMELFDSVPYKTQAEMLVQSLKASEQDQDNSMARLIELYKAQDLVGLHDIMQSETQGMSLAKIIDQRNANWIPIMERMMGEQRTFFAVGAGHLPGEKGVIALLRQKGYTLRPLR